MSIPILDELQKDLIRLTIAGADLAADDHSIKKKVPVLLKMGEKAPVFNKLGELADTLIHKEESRAKHLMELSQLLTSILYTMGKTGGEGEMSAGGKQVEYPSDISYLSLKPLTEALTTKGAGRAEVIRSAFQSGKTRDLRLVLPLINALDDSYQEIADFVADEVLPQYGRDILPLIQDQFVVKGKKGDARRLKVMSRFLGDEGLPLYLECAENGSEQVRNEALEHLHHYDEAEEILLKYAKAKKESTKKAALTALAKRGSAAAIESLEAVLTSKDYDMVLDIALENPSRGLMDVILSYAKQVKAEFKESKDRDIQDLFRYLISVLNHDGNAEQIEFLKDVIMDRTMPDILVMEASGRLMDGSREALQFVESICRMPGRSGITDVSFMASMEFRTPEEIFDLYSGDVKKTRKDPSGRAILSFMDQMVQFSPDIREFDERSRMKYGWYDLEENSADDIQWDKRWVDLLISLDEEHLVYRIARQPAGGEHIDYLLKKLAVNPYFSSQRGMGVMMSLIQIGYEHTLDVLLDILRKTDHNMKSVKFHTSRIVRNVGLFFLLPGRHADALQEAAAVTGHKELRDRLNEIAFEMRTKERV
ncbi:HEAT repeat domain-containing protein [Peribacillus sp. SCS-37]|uniref:HEAT repeat domain-containing protein n=1 Tax=Paraperibacillus esterisolvens TaxID=3115296 RepID=UPI003906C67E